jgi:sugar-specific transcriptional regulator TrmB
MRKPLSVRGAETSVETLIDLGFTDLEARVYAYLVQHSPATAYRAAQGIGKPVANTYKAVESLHQKEAILLDETGENRLCVAVPPAELLENLRKQFERRQEAAAHALAQLRSTGGEDGIFALTSCEQVYDRCTRMLEGAKSVALLDAFPAVVERFGPALEAAAGRRVAVAVQAYAPTELNVEIILDRYAERTLSRWPGQWLCLVVDGAEHLFAYMNRAGTTVHQAIWSASAFLGSLHHSNIVGSMRGQLLEQVLESHADVEEIKAELLRADPWSVLEPRGFRELHARFGDS